MRYHQILFLFGLTSIIFGQEAMNNLMTLSLEELMNVPVSLGTRGDDRTPFNSPAPIDVISAEDIRMSGLSELVSVLQRFVPSVNAPRPSITDGSDHVQAFSLRGLGADQMLVLINGIRKHNSALVHVNATILRGTTSNDLNVIPVDAIERIEILRDGAAAQYGSDAISGIINIVLKTNADKSVHAEYRKTTEGDGEAVCLASSLGYSLSDKDYLVVTSEFRDRDYTNRSIPRYDLTGPDTVLLNKKIYRCGDAKSRDMTFMYNYARQLSFNIPSHFYSHGYYSQRRGESAGYYRLPSQSRVPLTGFPEGFLPILAPVLQDKNLTLGFKTEMNDWKTNISFSYGKNSMQFNLENSLNSSLGPSSQRRFYCGTLNFQQYVLNINMFREMDIGLENPLDVGIGSELRAENFVQHQGEEASWIAGDYHDSLTIDGELVVRNEYPAGAQLFPGYMPQNERDKSRNSVSLYTDFESKISSTILLGLAGRFEEYSDFGHSFNSKFSFRFEPIEKLVIRATTSTGFRAPSLGQSYFTAIQTNNVAGKLIQSGTYSVNDPVAQELGATPLKPEKSFHLSAGLASRQINNLSIAIDFFYVHIRDRIILTGSFAQSNPSAYIQQVLSKYNIEGAKYFTNAIDTKTQGMDLVIKYNLEIEDIGALLFSAVANFNRTLLDGDVKVPQTMLAAKDVFLDRQQISKFEDGQPNYVAQFSIDYLRKSLETQFKLIRYGQLKYVENSADPSLDQTFNGELLCDLNINYKLSRQLTLQLGGHNIFNSYPDKFLPGRYDYYLVYFCEAAPYGFNGADFYSSLQYRF